MLILKESYYWYEYEKIWSIILVCINTAHPEWTLSIRGRGKSYCLMMFIIIILIHIVSIRSSITCMRLFSNVLTTHVRRSLNYIQLIDNEKLPPIALRLNHTNIFHFDRQRKSWKKYSIEYQSIWYSIWVYLKLALNIYFS